MNWRTIISWCLIPALVLGIGTMADAQTAKPKVTLELVLGVDVSGSIDSTEYNLQKNGYVNAFQDAAIINKINKAAGGIAVTYVEWSGASQQKQVVPWTLITDATSSNAFANLIKNSSRAYSGSTGVGNALSYATNLFATNSYDSDRQVIDMSGDGLNNDGSAPNKTAALAAGVDTINALCIDAPTGETGTFDWYKANVIGGKDPFAFLVKDFSDFSRAVSAKISQEILAEYAKFDYTYYYGGKQAGEYYKGYVYAPSDYYKVGYKQNVAKDENNDPGYYQITAESAANAAYKSLVGQVYVSEYYDLESKNKFTGTGLVNNSKAVGTSYLGTEVEYIVNNTNSLYRFGNYSNVFYEADNPNKKVDLELVLAVDVSGSIDSAEYNMQKTGYVNAFQDAAIINKIASKAPNGIAVTYVEWSDYNNQKQLVPWTLITNATSSSAFANLIKNSSRASSGMTGVGGALSYATNLFATNSYDSDRQVIDMSGDGKNNEGAAPNKAAALAAGVDTINALCIDAPTGETGTFDWYKANVIGGKDPFAFMVKDFSDFSRAVSAKISQEILAEYAKFDYTYYYGGKQAGEYYKGYVYAPSDYYKVGYKQNVAKDENNDPGYYQITAESAANAAYKSLVGQVYVSEYYDLESKNKFTGTGLVNNSKAVGTGYLGTEVSYIVNNTNSLYRFGNYSNVFYEADIPLDAGRFGFRFDYGNGDYYTGYFYAKYTDYNVGWNKETSAGEYSIIAKTYANVSKSVYGQVYLDKYYDTLSKKTFQSNQLISMFGSYYGNAFLGSESGWLIKAYTYPKYRFFGFGYFEAEGI